jgi:hypothetical protein
LEQGFYHQIRKIWQPDCADEEGAAVLASLEIGSCVWGTRLLITIVKDLDILWYRDNKRGSYFTKK